MLGENLRGFYNKEACEFIENVNLQKGLHFQHQLNGGEVQVGPYFLDGYDKERNLVFEYNEIGHYLKQEKIEKDEYRRNFTKHYKKKQTVKNNYKKFVF